MATYVSVNDSRSGNILLILQTCYFGHKSLQSNNRTSNILAPHASDKVPHGTEY